MSTILGPFDTRGLQPDNVASNCRRLLYIYSIQPLINHPYNHRATLNDCLSGRQTEEFALEFHHVKDDTLQVTMIAENRAQTLKRAVYFIYACLPRY
jgi:hypothetical protein